MQLHKLPKLKTRSKKRVGRGESSGKGKTSGRGAKGQKKRETVKAGFEGGQLPLYRRLPQRRGVGNQPKVRSLTITTAELNKLRGGSVVDEKNLRMAGLVPKSTRKIKIKVVANTKLEKDLKVALPVSKSAKKLILEAGGKVTDENSA
ncbi:MAG: 50S ribosomal protein L15 [Candidatus Woykebacteria bacterium GWB1_45_5]|uniref:Large ribosomal subunit protein uL15 n=2 Tax=Candidatus Woykeibacteriota TaxID=1817899 RepID=A0A1G1W2L4_9BACT|nr:MAG: 50S ribosomal protein L15 [Candidatus Woykebacteria bacterium GWA1_44_8]OGY23315.1 MAG: 50S ribosomal protein L15 [Candidatus Woykebacteria bacterium GWB1_45_5]